MPLAAGGGKPKAHTLQDSGDGFAAFLLVRLPLLLAASIVQPIN